MSTEGNERLERSQGYGATGSSRTSRRSCTARRERIKLVLAALACRGHVLFEDVPGTAKTVLARAIAASIERRASRRAIQCTPDLQPTDVTGLSVYNQQTREFEFRPGPVFANILLVDEINRAMPKTQSALLEAMAERQVTVDGVTRAAARPVPRDRDREPDRAGGHLPAAGGAARPLLPADARSATRRRRGDADRARAAHGHPLDDLQPVVRATTIARAASTRSRTSTPTSSILRWIVELVRATRELDEVALGASVRGEPRARADRPRLGAAGRARVRRRPRTSSALPAGRRHRVVFTPAFVAERRLGGRDAALQRFRAARASSGPAAGAVGRARAEGAQRSLELTWPPRQPHRSRSTRGGGSSGPPRRRDEHPPRQGVPTSRARGRTGRATTSARSTGRRRRAAVVGVAAATSSSSASGSPRRRRASCSSPTGGPAMALYPPELPWLHKPEAAARARACSSRARSTSARSSATSTSRRTASTPATPFWRPPRAQPNVWHDGLADRLETPRRGLRRARGHGRAGARVPRHRPERRPDRQLRLRRLRLRRPTPQRARGRRRRRGWDVVPVIVQDPTWEQSFPADRAASSLRRRRARRAGCRRAAVARRGRGAASGERGAARVPAARLRAARPRPDRARRRRARARCHTALLEWAEPAPRATGRRTAMIAGSHPRRSSRQAAVALVALVVARRRSSALRARLVEWRAAVRTRLGARRQHAGARRHASLFGEPLTARARVWSTRASSTSEARRAPDDFRPTASATTSRRSATVSAAQRSSVRLRAPVHDSSVPAARMR